MLQRADQLGKHPEFYNLFASNCMNNMTYHVHRQGGSLPGHLALLLTGFSDRALYEFGFIDTEGLPFDKAREAFRIDQWMQAQELPIDKTFSIRLREALAKQLAAAKAE
jgi:hypothetical protein